MLAKLDNILVTSVNVSTARSTEMHYLACNLNCMRAVTLLQRTSSSMREKYTYICARAFGMSSEAPIIVSITHNFQRMERASETYSDSTNCEWGMGAMGGDGWLV